MVKYGAKLDYEDQTLRLRAEGNKKQNSDGTLKLRLVEPITVPARSEIIAACYVGHNTDAPKMGIVEPHFETEQSQNIMVARCLVRPHKYQGRVMVPMRVANVLPTSTSLQAGLVMGHLVEAAEARASNTFAATYMVHPESNNKRCSPPGTKSKWLEQCCNEPTLTREQRVGLKSLLNKYQHIFSQSEADLGRANIISHVIDTGGATPIKQAPRRVPDHQRRQIEDCVSNMLNQGVIRESQSAWSSPICLVTKKDGTPRFCVDFRKLNATTRVDAYPLPRIDDSLDALAGSRFFSSLDLTAGYWQVEIKPKDRPKTAFSTPTGELFEFNVLPFGLVNAPSTFERLMEQVLAGLSWKSCLIYLDDILVFSDTFTTHLGRLEEVFKRLEVANLKMKPSKCHFAQRKIHYLGHIVSAEGVATDPAKIQAILDYPTPHNVKTLRSFIGLTSYYRRFVQNFSTIARPLFDLTKKDTPFNWSQSCQEAFEFLKGRLVTTPILAYPDFQAPFKAYSDASGYGIGCVLSQDQNGKERVICYASRTLTPAEQNYSVIEREALGLIYAVKVFRPYLYDHQFQLITDHNPLKWLRTMRNPHGKFSRWVLLLEEFHPTIITRKGDTLPHVDALSRAPLPRNQDQMEDDIPMAIAPIVGQNEIQQWQNEDADIQKVKEHLQSKTILPPNLSRIWKKAIPFLFVQNEILYYQGPSAKNPQLVIPKAKTKVVSGWCHDTLTAGHFGVAKTKQRAQERYFWPTMLKDLETKVKFCETCQRVKPTSITARAPLEPIA